MTLSVSQVALRRQSLSIVGFRGRSVLPIPDTFVVREKGKGRMHPWNFLSPAYLTSARAWTMGVRPFFDHHLSKWIATHDTKRSEKVTILACFAVLGNCPWFPRSAALQGFSSWLWLSLSTLPRDGPWRS
jgi:hypothetical protein